MKRPSKPMSWQARAVVFGLLPCVSGLLAAQALRWANAIWLSDAGRFRPFALVAISIAILVKLAFSPFKEGTSSVAAWLTLLLTWFYVPLWIWATEVPYSAAIVGRDGRVHPASEGTSLPIYKVWLLTDRPGVRIVNGVAGKLTASHLDLEFRFAEPYILTRRHGDDLAGPLAAVATTALREQSQRSRTSRIAFLQNPTVQDGVLARICSVATGGGTACPAKLSVMPHKAETALGSVWSTQYSEDEAIEEKHLPTLVQLLTQSDSPLLRRDRVFNLMLELAESVAPLALVAQRSHLISDDQFNELIRRILASPDCDDGAVAVLANVNRLSETQRLEMWKKVIGYGSIATIVENAAALRISDLELAQLAPRMRPAFLAAPAVAVQAIKAFGERLPVDTQRDAVDAIVHANAVHALSALEHLNFSVDLRRALVKKIIADVALEDFAAARVTKEKLQATLAPAEMRELISMVVKRSEMSEKWLTFALASLPVRDMTLPQRRVLLNGLLFESPKAALEFVSKNRDHLDPAEVGEITRDYTRTITRDFCLHLSHRNTNWHTKYFSDAQLEIFRGCAQAQ